MFTVVRSMKIKLSRR